MYAVQDVYPVEDVQVGYPLKYPFKLPTRLVVEKDGKRITIRGVRSKDRWAQKMIKGSLPFEWMRKTRR
jgi:hypothetical protein